MWNMSFELNELEKRFNLILPKPNQIVLYNYLYPTSYDGSKSYPGPMAPIITRESKAESVLERGTME